MRIAKTSGGLFLVAAVLFGAVGCAPGQVGSSPTPSSIVTDVVTPSPSPSEEDPAVEEEPAPVAEGAYLDYQDGAIATRPGVKVLFFHAAWCPQCRALDEQLTSDGAPDGMTVFKVDYDDRVDLRQKYGVTLQTTVVYVDDQGELLSSAVLYDNPSIDSLLAAAP